jgi:hypothetical protein
MKNLLVTTLLLLTYFLPAQTPTENLEVLMIGASHSYDPKTKQDLKNIHQKIREFKPQAFFGEWLSPEDEKSLKTYWNKENVMKRYDRLKSKSNIAEENLTNEIERLRNVTRNNPKDMKAKIDLAVAHYLSFDAGNGYFQMWKVAKYLQKNQKDTAVFNYARKKYFSAAVDSLHKAINPYIDDEYDYIAHPMMEELKLKYMYAMDSQRWDNQWSEAWSIADSILYENLEKYKKDSTSEIGKKVNIARKYVDNRMKYLENDALKNYSENHLTETLNGPQYTEWLYRINLVSDEYRQFDFFPIEQFGKKIHYWYMRNNDMCHNTLKRAKTEGFKKVVIIVGANHANIMTNIFREMGVKVTNINDAKM